LLLRVEYYTSAINQGAQTFESHTPASGKLFTILSIWLRAYNNTTTSRITITWSDDTTTDIDVAGGVGAWEEKDYGSPYLLYNIGEGVQKRAKQVDFKSVGAGGGGSYNEFAFAALEGYS